MPVSSATSMLVGMVATEEQVPKETAAGLSRCWNMTFAAPLPPPANAPIPAPTAVPPPPPMRPPLSVPDIDAQPPATIIAAAHVTHSKEIRLIEYSIF